MEFISHVLIRVLYVARSLCLLPVSMWRWYSGLYKGKRWYKKILLGLVSFFLLLYMIRPKELAGIALDKIDEISLNCR